MLSAKRPPPNTNTCPSLLLARRAKSGAMRSVRVVAAVIEQEGRFLITQRRPEAVLPMLWEFPGGRVEPGESDTAALQRELKQLMSDFVQVKYDLKEIANEKQRIESDQQLIQIEQLRASLDKTIVESERVG